MARTAAAEVPYPEQLVPGQLRGIASDASAAWNMGYWEYLPTDYEDLPTDDTEEPQGRRWPLLVFLGGIGQSDEQGQCPSGSAVCPESECDLAGLCRATRRGPMRLMRNGTWDDTQRDYIFVSPQHPVPALSTVPWSITELDAFFDYVVLNYPVDTRRMYLVGMSKGGRAVLEYAAAYPRRFTAVAPTPGGAVADDVTCRFQDTALWAFHGEDDTNANLGTGVFDPCWMIRRLHMYDHPEQYVELDACLERVGQTFPPGRMTVFYDTGHESWIPANDPAGHGFATDSWSTAQDCFGVDREYRPYRADLDEDGIYSWFASLDRPEVVAPDDLEVSEASVELTAVVIDDDPVSVTWSLLSGPAVTMLGADTPTLRVQSLLPDRAYVFEVAGIDEDGQWDVDTVTVTTSDVLGEGSTTTPLPGTDGTGASSTSAAGTEGAGTEGSGTAAPTSGTSTGERPSGTVGTDAPEPAQPHSSESGSSRCAVSPRPNPMGPAALMVLVCVVLGWRHRAPIAPRRRARDRL